MILADESAPGAHPTVSICNAWYCTFNTDTLLSSALAIGVTLVLGLVVAWRLRQRPPRKLQLVFELALDYVRKLVRDIVSEDADFIIPIAATIALYILIANWIAFFPLPKPIQPANSDLNQTLGLAIVVILVVQGYSLKVLGFRGYLYRFTKPFDLPIFVRVLFVPLNVIEEIVKPITLSLRLFGNVFAGIIMIYLLTTKLPVFVSWLPVVVWKFFDVFFVGAMQAFIFMLLTIIYFGMAREGLEEEHSVAHVHAA